MCDDTGDSGGSSVGAIVGGVIGGIILLIIIVIIIIALYKLFVYQRKGIYIHIYCDMYKAVYAPSYCMYAHIHI